MSLLLSPARVALLIVSSLLLAAGAPASSLFYADRDGLWRYTPGYPPVRLRPEPGRQTAYSFSPDHRHLSALTDQTSLMTIALDGWHLSGIRSSGDRIKELSWSPDSRNLAFAAGGLLRVCKPGGRQGRLAEVGDTTDLAWSPDGGLLAYGRYNQNGFNDLGLWVVPLSGGAQRRLSHPSGSPYIAQDIHWSPDGRWLAFVHGYEGASLAFVRPDGSGYRERLDAVGMICDWRPDSSAVVYVRIDEDYHTRGLFTCGPRGKPRLLRATGWRTFPYPLPDGRLLIIDRSPAEGRWSTIKLLSGVQQKARVLWFHRFDGAVDDLVAPAPEGSTVAVTVSKQAGSDDLYLIDGPETPVKVSVGVSQLIGWGPALPRVQPPLPRD